MPRLMPNGSGRRRITRTPFSIDSPSGVSGEWRAQRTVTRWPRAASRAASCCTERVSPGRRMLPSAANSRQPKAHLHPAIMIDDSDDLSAEDAEGTGGDSVVEPEATPEPDGEGAAPRRWIGIALAVLLLFSFGLRAW